MWSAFASELLTHDTSYQAGVYGAGATCQAARNAGLAQFSWLSGSMAWQRYDVNGPFDIIQEVKVVPPISLCNVNVDNNSATSTNFGAWLP